MSTVLLFCVAQIPIATINTLLSAPNSNLFSLAREPAQASFDLEGTSPPVEPFETGFLNYGQEQIRKFLAERLPDTPVGTNLESNICAILDEQSARDETVVIATAISSLYDRDPSVMTEEELDAWERECDEISDAPNDLWLEFRVKFKDAQELEMILAFESDFTQKLYNPNFVAEHTDEQGVLLLDRAKSAFMTRHRADDEL